MAQVPTISSSCARAFAGPDDVAVPPDPTYSLFRVAAELAGATVGEDAPVLTFCCRPGNPLGDMPPLPDARPLVVDEAYFEYAGESAVGLIDDGVVVIRTFSKAFALAGARIGYLLASRDTAAELRARQAPAPVSTLSVALALAALRTAGSCSRARRARAARKGSSASSVTPRSIRARTSSLSRCPIRVHLRISCSSAGVSSASPAAVFASLCAILRMTMCCSRRSKVRARRRDAAHGTFAQPRRRRFVFDSAWTDPAACALPPVPVSTTICSSSSPSTAASTSSSTEAAIGRPATTTPPRTRRSRSGKRSTRLSGTVAASRAMDRPSCPGRRARPAAVDLGGRRGAEISLEEDPGLARHTLESLAQAARMTLHVNATGRDPHHVAEAACKAVGRALREAVRREGSELPSTKGLL